MLGFGFNASSILTILLIFFHKPTQIFHIFNQNLPKKTKALPIFCIALFATPKSSAHVAY